MSTAASRFLGAVALVLPTIWLAGCGYGSAAIAGLAGSSSSGSTNAAPSLGGSGQQGLSVTQGKESPALLRLVLADAESDPATVELVYVRGDDPQQTEHRISDLPENPMTLATTPAGAVHDFQWDFPSEPNLPDDARFVENVTVTARLVGGVSRSVVLGLGNDAPEVTDVVLPPGEAVKVTPIGFTLRDSSDDVVEVEVEYWDETVPLAGWRVATPAGPNPSSPAFTNVEAPREGIDLVFFWDTDADLKDLETDVRLRFTARDSVETGVPVETATFAVDNNDPPIVTVGEGPFVLNSDTRRGIPVPYTAIDDEGDPVKVVFQWAPEDDPTFAALPGDPAAVASLLADPGAVERLRLCKPFPVYARGSATPVDAQRVKLPRLRNQEFHAASQGLAGREIELLRASEPTGLAATWSSNPLRAPVAAEPLGDGLTALVLDRGVSGSSRLLEVELATGVVRRTVASGIPGGPSGFDLTRDRQHVLVATDQAGEWSLYGVDVASGAVALAMSASACPAPCPSGALRAVARLGSGAALATAGDALWRLDWTDPANPRASVVVTGLRVPWGLVVDPLREGRVYVAERGQSVDRSPSAHHAPNPRRGKDVGGEGRVLSVAWKTRQVEVVVGSAAPGFPRPTALAFDRSQNRLLALCDPRGGTGREVRGLNLGATSSRAFALAGVDATATSVASGDASLLLVASPGTADLVAAGGVEQRREIASYEPTTATVTATDAFDPPVAPYQAWRVRLRRAFEDPIVGSPTGERGVFVWDTEHAEGQGRVVVRAIGFDTERGTSNQTLSPRSVASRFGARSAEVAMSRLFDVVAVDLDGDGDLDVAGGRNSAMGPELVLVYQDPTGVWTERATLALAGSATSILAADLDQDGRTDVACSVDGFPNEDEVTLFLQDESGVFTPLSVPSERDRALACADFDGDGNLDLIGARYNGPTQDMVAVYLQGPARVFRSMLIPCDGGPWDLAPADLDGDGDMDFACAGTDDRELSVYLQDASGGFVARTMSTPGHPVSVEAADLDGDGDLDLVAAVNDFDLDQGYACVYLQEAPAQWVAQPVLLAGKWVENVIVADMDGDGTADLVCDKSQDRSVLIYSAHSGGWEAGPEVASVGDLDGVADFDGDGRLDLLAWGSLGIRVYHRGGARGFSLPVSVAPGEFNNRIEMADVDADGDLDLLVAHSVTGGQGAELDLHLQIGSRDFVERATLPFAGFPSGVAGADMEGDGDLDLVIGRSFPVGLTVWSQGPPLQFQARTLGALGVGGPQLVDVDGDDLLDLVTANYSSNSASVYYRRPDGTFIRRILGTGGRSVSALAVDLDGDGDLDLASANLDRNTITRHVQTAPRIWTRRADLPVQEPQRLLAADLDGDRDMDLVTHGFVDEELKLLLQEESGQWSQLSPVALDAFAAGFVAEDLDGDGDMDFAATTSDRTLVTLYQDAPLTWRRSETAIGQHVTHLRAADLDGDGDVDLLGVGDVGPVVLWGRP